VTVFRRLPPPRDLDAYEQPVHETDPTADGGLPWKPGLSRNPPPPVRPFDLEDYRDYRRPRKDPP
jgi:hypothetical protein